ncbi:MAG: hypothetical protein AAGE99_00190 [Chlamydiota bacterium]
MPEKSKFRNRSYIKIAVLIFIFSIIPGSLLPIQAALDLTVYIGESAQLEWRPSHVAIAFYPNRIESKESLSAPTPVQLKCYSNGLNGWKVVADGENTALDRTFLLLSEDRHHSIRYLLVVEDENKRLKTIKSGDSMLEVGDFRFEPIYLSVYPFFIGQTLDRVPAGYYRGTLTASFIAN